MSATSAALPPNERAAALRSAGRQPSHRLPVHLTRFIGREAELAAVCRLLAGHRLVTLTGVGGAGKTRLAVETAAELAGVWADGAWWVDLASIKDPADVAAEVASGLGVIVEPVAGPLRSLAIHLRDQALLVCLDNCEHLLDSVAEVVDALLRSCPGVALLTTSREPLGVPGEVAWPVPPLGADDAFALFIDRARLVSPWLALDASGEAAVRAVCSRLDGIPLALELAAAWLRTLTPQQIEAGLENRFALLVRGPRGVTARQQSLAASIDWSHRLLEDRDRIVFRRLAVFAGSFSLAAARAVGGAERVGPEDVLDAVGRLVDKSLLVVQQHQGEARYRMLETIRQYAADRLTEAGEEAVTRDRHLSYFLAFAEGIEPERQRDMDRWRSTLELEYDELRAALDWGLAAPDPLEGRRLAAALPWLWHLHGHGHEGIDYLERAIRLAPDDRSVLQARLLTAIAIVADTAHPLDLEFDAAQRALDIATDQGDNALRALCLALSAVGLFYTDFDAAWSVTREALTAAEASGEAFVADAARALQGIILHLRDRHDEAMPVLQAALDGLLQRHRGIAATVLAFQARGALSVGDLVRARSLAEEAVLVADPLGDYLRVGSTRSVLALVRALAGDVDEAFDVIRPVLRLVEGAEHDVFVPELARTMGTLHLLRQEPGHAAQWLEREARSTDRGTETWLAVEALPAFGAALGSLGRADEARDILDRAAAAARRFGMPHVLAEAYANQAALVAAADPARALALEHAALSLRVEHGLRTSAVDSVEAIAGLAGRMQPSKETVRRLAAGEHARTIVGYPRAPMRQKVYAAAVAEQRAALGDHVFDEAWGVGSMLTVDEAMTHIRRSRGTRQRPPVGWASLTPTELEVVRLVVEGLSNPQIGSRLFMSRGTVKTHLSHIYAKLGVANRTELATTAATRLSGSG